LIATAGSLCLNLTLCLLLGGIFEYLIVFPVTAVHKNPDDFFKRTAANKEGR